MKTLPAALIANIAAATGAIAYLLDISLAGGGTLRYTSWDRGITYGGNLYTPRAFSAGDLELALGEQSNGVTITVDDTDNGAPLRAAALGNFLRGQAATVYFCMPDADDVPVGDDEGVVRLFGGRMGPGGVNLREVTITIEGWLTQLNRKVPTGTFGPTCRFSFRSTECGYTHADAQKTGQTADAGCTTLILQDAARTESANWWAGGWVVMTSGATAGMAMTIAASAAGNLTLSHALPAAPAAGDQYSIYQGCNKSEATCTAKYGNFSHHGGFPSLAELEERK